MRKSTFALLATTFFPFQSSNFTFDSNAAPDNTAITAYKTKNSVACTPDRLEITSLLDSLDIPQMPGAGSYKWKIDTRNDSAQFYFNQGINMYYGFHIIESLASFKKAAKFDAENPMIWWAQALAYGPNINDAFYNASPEALEATENAIKFSDKSSAVEKALIHAMSLRYSNDSTKTRDILNQTYTDAMKDAYSKYPSDADVMTLYVDAVMLQHPWDLWNINGTPKPWTPEIQKILEKALTIAPMHPGANHYYIHVIEPSPNPEKALASADVLGKIAPGLAHLVHMPSHIYLRTGEFNRGAAINKDAVMKYQEYKTLFPPAEGNAFIYEWHNNHMLANCAMHAGKYKDAITAAYALRNAIDTGTLGSPAPIGSYIGYMYMTPALINIRFEKWDSLLNMPKPASQYVYANILYHFGRGIALSARNNTSAAREEEKQMKELMKNEDLKIPMSPFSAIITGAICANEILNGFINLKENKNTDAIAHFKKAEETELQIVYNEPRDWLLNTSQYLATAYLAAKDYANAEKSFRYDLTRNDKNVWSLNGLQKTLKAQNKTRETSLVQNEFKKASSGSDVDFGAMKY